MTTAHSVLEQAEIEPINRTHYKQQNYVKTAYKIPTAESIMAVSWPWLMNRHAQLEEIGFEATLKEYHSKNQRKLMTKALRKEIMKRDHYTCQMCGKFMPDEVGLHIILITSFRLQKAAKQSRPIYRCCAQNAMGPRVLRRAKKIPSKNESITAAEAGFCGREERHISTYFIQHHRPAGFFAQAETKLRIFRLNVQDSVPGSGGKN